MMLINNFFINFIRLTTATILLIALVNFVVDPFLIFGIVNIAGFNSIKTEADRFQRLYKAYEVKRIKPDTLILGTSRALFLNPDHQELQGKRVYNLALTSGSSYETYRYLQHALANHPVKEIIFGLDFPFSGGVRPTYKENRLNAELDGSYCSQSISSRLDDVVPSLLSFAALKASYNTIRKQLGVHPLSAREEKALRVRKKGGHRKMFLAEERNYFSNNESAYPECLDSPPPKTFTSPEYQYFEKIINLAYRDGITLRLFISPTHARYNEILCAQGVWHEFEKWKEKLVEINEREARHAGQRPFQLIDFSGYNHYTSESVPAPGDTSSIMQWYWEGVHYSTELGDLLISLLYDEHAIRQERSNFGVPLSSENIAAHLSATRKERQNYLLSHPEEINDIVQIVLDLKKRREQ